MSWIWAIIIGGIAGWLASLIVAGRGLGLLWDIILGILGAIVGNWVFAAIGVPLNFFWSALIGAIIILLITRLFRRPGTI